MIITINTTSRTSRLVFNTTLLIFGATLCSTAAYSWTGPTSTAPDANVSAPINVGTLSQIKDGALSVNGFSNVGSSYIAGRLGVGVESPTQKFEVAGSAYITGNLGIDVVNPAQKVHVNGRVRATGFCIGTSCVTSWPATEGVYGGSTWSAWLSTNNASASCANGRVMTGTQTAFDGDQFGVLPGSAVSIRIRCTVLTP
jgi:hypothetical protein